jgi:hypothetical protein
MPRLARLRPPGSAVLRNEQCGWIIWQLPAQKWHRIYKASMGKRHKWAKRLVTL